MLMMIEFITPMFRLTKESSDPRKEEMAPFNNGVNRDAEEREESPQKGNDDPSCKELFAELVCGAVHG